MLSESLIPQHLNPFLWNFNSLPPMFESIVEFKSATVRKWDILVISRSFESGYCCQHMKIWLNSAPLNEETARTCRRWYVQRTSTTRRIRWARAITYKGNCRTLKWPCTQSHKSSTSLLRYYYAQHNSIFSLRPALALNIVNSTAKETGIESRLMCCFG